MKKISFPPEFASSDEDETQLQRLKEDEITIRDTALGKESARLQKESLKYIASMTEEERAACNMPVNVLEELKEMVVGEVAEVQEEQFPVVSALESAPVVRFMLREICSQNRF